MKTFGNRLGLATLAFWALCASACAFAEFAGLERSVALGIWLGASLAALIGATSWASLAWAWHRSDKVFFGAFFAGMLWKLFVLGWAFAFVARHPAVHPAAALLSLSILTLFYSVLESGFLGRMESHGF